MARKIKPWTATEIAEITHGQLYGASDWQVLDVSTDTRKIKAGELFIALSGENFRGEDFVQAAKENNAVGAIVSELCEVDLPQIVVADTLQALQALAVERRERSEAKFVALTGSNGKTSTKEMLSRILATVGKTLATQGNLNNDIGVPLTLLRLRDDDEFAVIEMGANRLGDIKKLVVLAQPDVALITNIGVAHLEGFGSLEGVFATKSEIYTFSQGAMIYNDDSSFSSRWSGLYPERVKKSFSITHQADVWASDIASDGSAFTLNIGGLSKQIIWQMQGKHNVANALGACAVASFLAIPLEKMTEALSGLKLDQSRLVAIPYGKHLIYDDTYNANPSSFKAGIEVLSAAKNTLIIAGGMGELGENSAALHREVADFAKAKGINQFWALEAPQYDSKNYEQLSTLIDDLEAVLKGDIAYTVLIKGSRSAKMERVLQALPLHKENN